MKHLLGVCLSKSRLESRNPRASARRRCARVGYDTHHGRAIGSLSNALARALGGPTLENAPWGNLARARGRFATLGGHTSRGGLRPEHGGPR
jgi:hypothetical protein